MVIMVKMVIIVKMVIMVVTGGHDAHSGQLVMVVMVLRKGQTSQIRQRGQIEMTFNLDFPGNL